MPFTHFPYGASSLGIPLVGAGLISIPNGRGGLVWFVDTTNGSDGNQGLDPTQPLKTIGQAILKAGNGTGDTIYVFPGTYAEALTVNKDYLAIIGATMAGYAKPDIGGGLALTVSAQGFMSRHCRYYGVADDTIVQEGNGFLYDDCVFDGDLTASKGVRLVGSPTSSSLSASEGRIQNCLFRGCALGLIFDSAAIGGAGTGSTDNDVLGNRFYGNTIDIAAAKTGAGGVYSVKTVRVLGNSFEDKNKTTYIDITTNCDGAAGNQTGAIDGNYFAADAITAGNEVKLTGTGFTFTGNLYTVGIKDGSALD